MNIWDHTFISNINFLTNPIIQMWENIDTLVTFRHSHYDTTTGTDKFVSSHCIFIRKESICPEDLMLLKYGVIAIKQFYNRSERISLQL